MPLLEMQGISKAFSGVYANEDISLIVEKGEIHALLGENGAGKTTLMNILYGLYRADKGRILWKGEEVSFSSPKEAIRAGIGMVQQHFSLVRDLSVLDNVILNVKTGGFFLNRKQEQKKLEELSKRYGLEVDPDAKIADLSVGERQRVEILKALSRNVELLILDEPTGVLTPQETAHFFDVLRSLKAEGYGIVIITHRMSEIMEISDRVTVLRDGRLIAEADTADTTPDELSGWMIGRRMDPSEDRRSQPREEVMLEVSHVSRRAGKHTHALRDLCFCVRKGEIFGLAGVEGNGQKELAEVLTGLKKKAEGQILFDGQDIMDDTVRTRYEKGLAYISDDRQNDSLITGMDITENLALRAYAKEPYAANGVIRRSRMRKDALSAMEEYQVKASGKSGPDTRVSLLSGGNQQKLIIARELSGNVKLILAAQPTRGLDIGAAQFVRSRLLKARGEGKSVLLISADLEEILTLCDRIAVLYNGGIAGILNRKDADVRTLGLLMGGVAAGTERSAHE